MANNYYNFDNLFVPGTKARSDQVNTEYQALEAAFDLLPTDPNSLTRGTTVYAGLSTGAANAYEVALPNPRASDGAGDVITWLAHQTNTGPATLEADGNGARPLVRADGSAIAANDIETGLLYAVIYDDAGSRWQLIGPSQSYLTDAEQAVTDATAQAVAAAASAANAAVSEGNASTSAAAAAGSASAAAGSADEAEEWAVNPVDDDITTSPGQFSSLHWAFGARDWAIRAEDDPVPVNFGGDGSTEFSAFHWAQKASQASGLPLSPTDGQIAYFNAGSGDWEATSGLLIDETNEVVSTVFDGALTMPSGTTAERPSSAVNGMVRYNTDVDLIEIYENGAWRTGASQGGNTLNLNYLFSSITTMVDPGSERFRYNNSVLASVTQVAISDFGSGGFDNTALLGLLSVGDRLYIQQDDDATRNAVFTVTGITDNTTWFQLDVTFEESESGLTPGNAEACTVLLLLAGSGSALNLGNLNDVDVSGAIQGNLLFLNGGQWEDTLGLEWDVTNRDLEIRNATANDPGLGQAQTGLFRIKNTNAIDAARWGFENSANLITRNLVHGGSIQFTAQSLGGVTQTLATMTPGGAFAAYHDGQLSIQTTLDGADFFNNDGAGFTGAIRVFNGGGTEYLQVFKSGSGGGGGLRNFEDGGEVSLEANNAVGALQPLFTGDPDDAARLYNAGNLAGRTIAEGFGAVGLLGNNPATSGTQDVTFALLNSAGQSAGQILYTNGTQLRMRNLTHGGGIRIEAEDNAGVMRDILLGDPDTNTTLYDQGVAALQTLDAGIGVRPSSGADDTTVRVTFEQASGTDKGTVGYNGSDSLSVRNLIPSGAVEIRADDAGSTSRLMAEFSADAGVKLYDGSQGILFVTNSEVLIGSGVADGDLTLREYSSAETDITGLTGGTTFGAIIEAPNNAHLVVGIRGNDTTDGFHVLDTNQLGDSAYVNSLFRVTGLSTFLGYAGAVKLGTVTDGVDVTGNMVATGTVQGSGTTENAPAASFRRTSAQQVQIFGNSTANTIQSLSDTAASKNLIINATTNTSDGAGTLEPAIILRSRGNDELTIGNAAIDFHGNRLDAGATIFPIRSSGTSLTLQFQNSSGTVRGDIEASAAGLTIDSVSNNLPLNLASGGTNGIVIDENANNDVRLFHNGAAVFGTKDHNANYNTSGAYVFDHGGTEREIGFNVMPLLTENGNFTLSEIHAGAMIRKTSGAGNTMTLPNGTSGAVFPVGATCMIYLTTSNTLTVSAAGTLSWLDGSGTISTGNRTLSRSCAATIYKVDTNDYLIFGTGIT